MNSSTFQGKRKKSIFLLFQRNRESASEKQQATNNKKQNKKSRLGQDANYGSAIVTWLLYLANEIRPNRGRKGLHLGPEGGFLNIEATVFTFYTKTQHHSAWKVMEITRLHNRST